MKQTSHRISISHIKSDTEISLHKTDHLPSVFVSEEYDATLLTLVVGLLNELLLCASQTGKVKWSQLMADLQRLGITEIKLPRQQDMGVFLVRTISPDQPDWQRPGQERRIPIGATTIGFTKLSIKVERTWINDEHNHPGGNRPLQEALAIMAYLFCLQVLPGATASQRAVFLRLDSTSLTYLLDRAKVPRLNAQTLTKAILRSHIRSLIES